MEGEFYLPDRPQIPSLWPGLTVKLISLRTLGVLGLGYRSVTEGFWSQGCELTHGNMLRSEMLFGPR